MISDSLINKIVHEINQNVAIEHNSFVILYDKIENKIFFDFHVQQHLHVESLQ